MYLVVGWWWVAVAVWWWVGVRSPALDRKPRSLNSLQTMTHYATSGNNHYDNLTPAACITTEHNTSLHDLNSTVTGPG